MKHYKFSATNGKKFIFTLIMDSGDMYIVPENPVAEKYLGDLRRLLPATHRDRTITLHERHGALIAEWLRLLIRQGEGVDNRVLNDYVK